ncbi:MAG: N-acetyl-gamma-glutamyl-phosphate reductase [Caulobacteraceae bacterium]|nr:MAG: N-acetyl-gamma-glutamyl-phosphate reductase [Caulobacteraceae bacterium]
MTAPKIFIDGEAGTTGLQIRERLEGRTDIQLVSIDPARRKDADARAELLNSVDLVILCLPDEAAIEAVGLISSDAVKIIDASTAHRVADGWTYGVAELPGQRAAIAASARVSNPGCYPTGAIALIRPLVDAGILPADYPVSVNAVSGYTGGGKAMIAEFEGEGAEAFRIYGLTQSHKHVPELQKNTGLTVRPFFAPSVGRYAQGMIVEVPLFLDRLNGRPALTDLEACLRAAYVGEPFVTVEDTTGVTGLEPQALNNTNRMQLFVFGGAGQVRLVARLDNLGKGASGAAVQNMNLMLGLPETAGL